MIIDRILHVRGSEMNFYAPSYFKRPSDIPTGGKLYGYGKDLTPYVKLTDPTSTDYTVFVVIDMSKYAKEHRGFGWFVVADDGSISVKNKVSDPDGFLVGNPLVPPSVVSVGDGIKTHDTTYMDYWLGYYNGKTPNIVDPSANIHVHVGIGSTVYNNFRGTIELTHEPSAEGESLSELVTDGTVYYKYDHVNPGRYIEMTASDLSEFFDKQEDELKYTVKDNVQVYTKETDDDAVEFTFDTFVVRQEHTLPIVNGFVCYPEVVGSAVKACDAVQYLSMSSDRSRGYVLVDFEQVGGCSFWKLDVNEDIGSVTDFVLPSSLLEEYDPSRQTILVVLDGRLLLTSDYSVVDGHVIVDKTKFGVVPELDRLLCTGAAISANSRLVSSDGSRDILRSDNSFVIVVNSPNLQMVLHEPWFNSSEKILEHGNNSYEALDRNQFDQTARGLLYDRTTKSVISHSREEHTSTSYAEDLQEEVKYRTSTVTTIPERPLVVLAGTCDNLMSAKAMVFDDPKNVARDDVVAWPRWCLVDMIFRG